mgnify:CR=1 FL=1
MEIPFLAWLLQSVPETIGTVSIVICLGYGYLYWKPIIIIGLIQAVLVYLIRLLPITFGVHTVILIITLAVLSSWIGRININKAIVYSNISILILILSEFIIVNMWIYFANFSLNEITNVVAVRVITGMPQVIILFLTAVFISKRNLMKNMVKTRKI